MRRPAPAHPAENVLWLGVAGSAAAVAVFSLREPEPPGPGLWLATAGAAAVALTAGVALWLGGRSRRGAHASAHREPDGARDLLSAIPDGLFLVDDARLVSVNRRLCELVGFAREELLGGAAPFPFWPPEHRHELEAWHRRLAALGEDDTELTFRHRNGTRMRVLVAGRTVPGGNGAPRHLVTVRDVSESHRRERRLAELSARDPETGLLNGAEFEERLGHAVRRATASGANLTVVLAEVGLDGVTGAAVFHRPEGLVAVERLRSLVRAGDEIARTREGELAWLLPETDVHGGIGAVARARTELAVLPGVTLTVGVCDLATAGDAFALYAFADRALVAARQQGVGGTAQHAP